MQKNIYVKMHTPGDGVSEEVAATRHRFCGEYVYAPRRSGFTKRESRTLRRIICLRYLKLKSAEMREAAEMFAVNRHILTLQISPEHEGHAYLLSSLERDGEFYLAPPFPEPKPPRRKRRARSVSRLVRDKNYMLRQAKHGATPEAKAAGWRGFYGLKSAQARAGRPQLPEAQQATLKALASSMGSAKAYLSKAVAAKKGLHFRGKSGTQAHKEAVAEVNKRRPVYEAKYAEYLATKEAFERALKPTASIEGG